MSKGYPKKSEAEWSAVIKAQDETSKILLKQEEEIKKKSMIKYKEELDKQIYQKHLNMIEVYDDLKDQRNYLKEQSEVMKRHEKDLKNADRKYEKVFLLANKDEEHQKRKKLQQDLQKEREIENLRIRESLEFEQKRKTEEASLKNKIIHEQQKLINQANQLKKEKFSKIEAEKEKERKMIEKNMEEMKIREQSFKNFYDKKLATLEEKSKLFQPVMEKDRFHQDLIQKRNQEWEKISLEKLVDREKHDEMIRKKAVSDMRYELDRQIHEKHQKRLNELQEGFKEQEIAKNLAQNEKIQQKSLFEEKRKKMNDLKNFLEKQLDEKQKNLEGIYMDPVEKQINQKLLQQVSNQKPVAFVGIPGIHNSESPLKHSFERVFRENAFDKREVRDTEFSSDSFHSVSKSFSGYPEKTRFKAMDLNKHDPIINPIGSYLPKVLPGQRIVRGGNSNSTFGRNASNILYHR
jgi:hypothetical protein